ncbi:TetR/AcrR family transcriptional regulator [Streptomyces fuscigenes]|uniref:TetR/AcrR family transcriptional regulator n=1 Tax=Streptomyces fuscigenes TaxID=1528880 RepID=UPI001F42E0E6|nr:TetR/AcrR family transcriptional regulator [Streptomyces fuscigenes]MCF3964363.1 TetR/AcrR family transcriptional regulator [Streptomyces fuscigenes]
MSRATTAPGPGRRPSGDGDGRRALLLDAAEKIFNARGIQAVGMDRLRSASGLPLKRIYELFPGKDAVVVATLRRRHTRMMADIGAHVDAAGSPRERVLSLFDWFHEWFETPEFRGCPWMNAYGELGPTNPAIAAEVYHHQREFRALLTSVPRSAGCSEAVVGAVYLLAEGAVAAAAVQHSPSPAAEARAAVAALLAADAPASGAAVPGTAVPGAAASTAPPAGV